MQGQQRKSSPSSRTCCGIPRQSALDVGHLIIIHILTGEVKRKIANGTTSKLQLPPFLKKLMPECHETFFKESKAARILRHRLRDLLSQHMKIVNVIGPGKMRVRKHCRYCFPDGLDDSGELTLDDPIEEVFEELSSCGTTILVSHPINQEDDEVRAPTPEQLSHSQG